MRVNDDVKRMRVNERFKSPLLIPPSYVRPKDMLRGDGHWYKDLRASSLLGVEGVIPPFSEYDALVELGDSLSDRAEHGSSARGIAVGDNHVGEVQDCGANPKHRQGLMVGAQD